MIMEGARVHARIHHVGGVGQFLGHFQIFDFGADPGLGTPSLMMIFRKWLVELRGVNLLSSKQYRGVVHEPETGATTFYDIFPKSSNFATSDKYFRKSDHYN